MTYSLSICFLFIISVFFCLVWEVFAYPDIINMFSSLISQKAYTFTFHFRSVIHFFLFLFLLYFALQYCIGFVTHWHESAIGVHEFPILNPPPTSHPISSLWIIPVHQPQASCIEPRLAIRFLPDSIHVSMPFSQIIPQGWSREMIWGGRWEGGSGLGIHVHQ